MLGPMIGCCWSLRLGCAVLCCAVLCCAVLCCAVLCCAVLCCAVCHSCIVNASLGREHGSSHTQAFMLNRHCLSGLTQFLWGPSLHKLWAMISLEGLAWAGLWRLSGSAPWDPNHSLGTTCKLCGPATNQSPDLISTCLTGHLLHCFCGLMLASSWKLGRDICLCLLAACALG